MVLHLFQLLNESEATVLRLTEQASVLKGEIRRLERNQERENAISNMEYLKNIVYKVGHSDDANSWNCLKFSHLLGIELFSYECQEWQQVFMSHLKVKT